MQRRQLLASTGAAIGTTLAGCSSSADSSGSQEQYAQNAVDVVDDELGVLDWDVDEDRFYLEFATSGNPGHDIQVVGGSFAGAVDAGLDRPLDGVAVDEQADETDYWVDVEVDWAQEFMADEITEAEYLDRMEGTIE